MEQGRVRNDLQWGNCVMREVLREVKQWQSWNLWRGLRLGCAMHLQSERAAHEDDTKAPTTANWEAPRRARRTSSCVALAGG